MQADQRCRACGGRIVSRPRTIQEYANVVTIYREDLKWKPGDDVTTHAEYFCPTIHRQ